MKKMILAMAMAFAAIFSANAMRTPINDEEKVIDVIQDYYPHLLNYFADGVMEIGSLTEEILADGETEYNIRYKFVNYRLNDGELNSLLKAKYPEIFYGRQFGFLKDVTAIRYVDKETGEIKTKVVYNKNNRPRRRQMFRR